MSRSRLISPRNVTLVGVAILACTGCRSRQPAVILSPKYQVPNPYTGPTAQAVVATPVARPAVTAMIGAPNSSYAAPVPPAIPKDPVITNTAIAPVNLRREPALAVEPVVAIKAPVIKKTVFQEFAPIEAAKAPKPELPKRGGTWTVQKGDSLWAIGRRYGVKVKDLAAANGISTKSLLKIGQKLRIPQEGWKAPSPAPVVVKASPRPPVATIARSKSPASVNVGNGSYTVARGDSLWKIARANGVSVNDLKAWNQLSDNMLQPGQVLKIKGAPVEKVATPQVQAGVKVSSATEAKPPAVRGNLHLLNGSASSPPTPLSPSPLAATGPKPRVLPHYVAPGDSLRSIAMLYDANEASIKEKNPQVDDFGRLVPGTRIEVPLATVGY